MFYDVFTCLAHLDWKLIVCCPPISPPVCKLSTFSSSFPEPLGWFQPNLAQGIIGKRGFKYIKIKYTHFQWKQNYKIAKIHCRSWRIFSSWKGRPISTKFGTKRPWIKGIQVCSNKGPRPFQGYNYNEIRKKHWKNL